MEQGGKVNLFIFYYMGLSFDEYDVSKAGVFHAPKFLP